MTNFREVCRYCLTIVTVFIAAPIDAQPMTDEEFGLVYSYELTVQPRAASRFFQNIENAVLKTERFQGLDHSLFRTRVPSDAEVFRKAIVEEARPSFSDTVDFILNPSIGVGVPVAPGTVLGYSVSLNSPVFSDTSYSAIASDRLAKVREFLSDNPELAEIADEHAKAQLGH